ncbi:MAG: hypothetical protein LBM60_03560 [Clostridium sp.]|jgi:ADP-ribose pyrophosphatase YjhB (NUDIX family)|nr:hypothetical protein [Clostridium sp.]
MTDILFSADNYTFSYRTSGILVQGGMVLLQKPTNSDEYALPGSHIPFGETHAETLTREWKKDKSQIPLEGSFPGIEHIEGRD